MACVEPGPLPGAGGLVVDLVYAAAPHQIETEQLHLPPGARVADAIASSRLVQRLGPEVMRGLRWGLWGRLCEPGSLLQPGDRLELLRPLTVDPMEARRRRLQRDGLRKPARRVPRRVADDAGP